MSSTFVSIIAGAGMLGFSIFKIWKMVQFSRKRSASQAWPEVAGEVTSKRVSERRSGRRGTTSYHPVITYRYTIMGQEFEKELDLAGMFSRRSAQAAIDNVGSTIPIRYNPEDPGEHISEKEKFNVWDIPLVVLTLGLAAVIFYMLVF